MIVDPDFLDHWRTRMVVDALDDDEMAPLCILRLWAHCQARKSDRFEMPTAGLKAQCRYKGDAQKFEQALSEAGFVERDGKELHVLGWAEQNASLIAAWENGAKGGRPKSKPEQNPQETHGKPMANQDETHAEPIREEKIREEKKEPKSKAEDATASRLPADWVPPSEFVDFCKTERPDLDPLAVGDRFRDHWIAQPGKDGRKTNWLATWRNWVRRERAAPQARASPGKPEKFDPTAYVNQPRNQPHERTITLDATGEPV